MSSTTVLAIAPGQRPVDLLELRNGHGWSPSIWSRLLEHNGHQRNAWIHDLGALDPIWQAIETLPEWQQAPLVLTLDTGVIPFQAYEWAAENLDEFDKRLPAPEGHVNHVHAVAELLRSKPEAPLVGVYGTSVSENPFDPWDEEADDYGSGIPLAEMYVLERHRDLVLGMFK